MLTPLVVVTCLALGPEVFVSTQETIRCLLCDHASFRNNCSTVTCDKTLMDCYMEEIVTDQLTVVYNGGCLDKRICSNSGKRETVCVGCSRCCDYEDECNGRLCGIKTVASGNITECYSCDGRTAEQSDVLDPSQCVTMKKCEANEVCYATQSDVAGRSSFYYGCLSKLHCQFLMQKAFDNYKLCLAKVSQPHSGMTREQACAILGKRSATLCHACCADDGCNHGSCENILETILALAQEGRFNMKTLKMETVERRRKNCLR